MTDNKTTKPDAEIYANVGKQRWPYVDEPRPTFSHGRGVTVTKRRPPSAGPALAESKPVPKPLAPAGATVDAE